MPVDLQLVGEVLRLELRADLANVVRLVEMGIGIGTVKAVEAKSRSAWTDSDIEEFLRTQRTGKGRIRIELVEIAPCVEAAQHTGRVALALLLLDTHAVVVFAEIVTHQVDGRLQIGRAHV